MNIECYNQLKEDENMTKEKEEQSKKLGEVIKKAWDDEAFMARLLKDATTVLAEEGIVLPEGMEVKAVQNSEKLTYLVVPPKPSSAITDCELDTVAGGYEGHKCGIVDMRCWGDNMLF
jgi:hypothetical protein